MKSNEIAKKLFITSTITTVALVVTIPIININSEHFCKCLMMKAYRNEKK